SRRAWRASSSSEIAPSTGPAPGRRTGPRSNATDGPSISNGDGRRWVSAHDVGWRSGGAMITDVEVRGAGVKGYGVFALRPFAPGEFIFRRRHSRVVPSSELDNL